MTDEQVLTIIIFCISLTGGILLFSLLLIFVAAAIKAAVNKVQSAIYHLLNGR